MWNAWFHNSGAWHIDWCTLNSVKYFPNASQLIKISVVVNRSENKHDLFNLFSTCRKLAFPLLFSCHTASRVATFSSHRWQHPIVINIQLHLASSRREDCTHSFRCTCYLPHSVCSRLSQLPFSVSSLTNISLPDDLFWSLPHAEMTPEQLESNQAKLTD